MALKAGGSGGFKYKKRDPDAVKKRAEQDGGAFDSIFKSGTDTFRPAQGTNTIRFIPPTWEDPEHYGFDIWVHQYVGADNGSYVCPKKMLQKRCPICEAQAEANEAGEEEEAKQLKAVKKVAAYIVDRNDKKPIPKIWLMSWTMDRDISTLCHSEKTGKTLLLDDPEVGYDVSFKRTGQQLNTRYLGLVVDRDDSPLLDTQKEINKLMEQVSEDRAIPELLVYRDEKYLEAVVNGTSAKKDPDDDGAEETPRRRRKPEADDGDVEEERPSRRRARDEEPEEEPAPRRRRAAEAEEPEDEPAPRRRRAEPEEEPEEEPAPRRRRSEPEPEEEERPSRRRRSEPEDEPEEEPAPRRRRSEPEPEEEERPSRRRRAEPEEEPEEEPAPRRRRAEPEEEPEEPAPRRRRSAPEPDEADEPEERPSRRRRSEPEEEEEPAPRRRR